MSSTASGSAARPPPLHRGPSPTSHRLSSLRTPTFSALSPGGVPLTPRHFSPGGSLHTSEEPLILEIGSKLLRAGFASESAPRCTLAWNAELCLPAGDISVDGEGARRRRELWEPNLQNVDLGLVADLVERGVRVAYNKYLLIDSKTRKVLLPIPPLLPTRLLTTAVHTIFTHFQPPSITLLSQPVLATIAAGLRSALVMDIGWHETVVTPVYELRPIEGRGIGVHGRCRRGIKALKDSWITMLRAELERAGADTEIALDEAEEIMERVGWCRNPSLPGSTASYAGEFALPITSTTPPTSLEIPFEKLALPAERTFFANSTTPSETPNIADDDDAPLPELLYAALLHSTVDVRAACLGRVIIVGGGARIPGLQKRVVDELRALVEMRGWARAPRDMKRGMQTRARPVSGVSAVESEPPSGEVTMPGTPTGRDTPDATATPGGESVPGNGAHGEEEVKKEEGVVPKGEVRGVKSLGVWAGGSLLAGLKVKGKVELEREKFLSAVTGGGSGFPLGVL